MTPAARTLERYALKVSHYSRVSGVALGSHAIPDSYFLMHMGVGCKFKGASQTFLHDWGRQPHRRESWTEVAEAELIQGAAQRIGPYVRSSHERYAPGLILVTSSTPLEMTSEDITAATQEADATVECPVRYIPGRGFSGDLFDGYAEVLRVVLGLVPWADTPPRERHVSVVGYLFDRYEGDHRGNLQQVRLLLRELGLELDAVLLSGQPLARLARAARSSTLIALPYAHRLVDDLEATGRQVVRTGLPMGLRGTAAWLRQVGAACDVPEDRVEATIARLSGHARTEIAMLRERTWGGRSAVFGELPLALGLYDVVHTLGLPARLVGLRTQSFGDADAFAKQCATLGLPPPGDLEILTHPSVKRVRSRLRHLIDQRRIVAALGSAGELALLPQWAPRTASAEPFSERHARFARLIIGYPSSGYHALQPSPFLGYGGVVVLAQRLLEHLYGGVPL